jgi:hypothetical protein
MKTLGADPSNRGSEMLAASRVGPQLSPEEAI